MSSDIWEQCAGESQARLLQETAIRVVESQQRVATWGITDTAAEQLALEQLIDGIKPVVLSRDEDQPYHYLLYTPFRYPPLKYGSRFGRNNQPSLFYGSLDVATALAEAAYYRFVFWSGMAKPIKRLRVEFTSFEAAIRTRRAIRLELPPFSRYRQDISHPMAYEQSQLLGDAMRRADIVAFTFTSARSSDNGINIALFSINAFKEKKPKKLQTWDCTTTPEKVSFLNRFDHEQYFAYELGQFQHDGQLAMPAP